MKCALCGKPLTKDHNCGRKESLNSYYERQRNNAKYNMEVDNQR
jgi:hypothetical protein